MNPGVSQVLGGKCPKCKGHFKAYQNPRVVLENTLGAKSCANPNFLVFKFENFRKKCIFLVAFDNFSDFWPLKKGVEIRI